MSWPTTRTAQWQTRKFMPLFQHFSQKWAKHWKTWIDTLNFCNISLSAFSSLEVNTDKLLMLKQVTNGKKVINIAINIASIQNHFHFLTLIKNFNSRYILIIHKKRQVTDDITIYIRQQTSNIGTAYSNSSFPICRHDV